MNNADLTHIITSAIALLERGHCHGHFALNAEGEPRGVTSSDATAWCLTGALFACCGKDDAVLYEVMELICQANDLPMWTTSSNGVRRFKLVAYNDAHTQRQVIALLQRAIGLIPSTLKVSLTEYSE